MRWAVVALMVAGIASPAAGQAAQDIHGDSLTLSAALRATLALSPDIRLGAQQVSLDQGVVLAASGQFDTQWETDIASGRASAVSIDPGGGPGLISQTQNSLAYSLGVTQQFRSGITFTPSISVTRTDVANVSLPATGQATVGLNLTVPLAKDRWGAITAATERSALRTRDAGVLQQRQTIAQSAFNTVVAYWNYLAAVRNRAVFVSSEDRAQKIVNETRVLVKAEERTESDLTQVLANLAAKRATRISAEQSVIQAQQQLGLAMGIAPESIAVLAPPATDFPRVPNDSTMLGVTSRFIDQALHQRTDLAAADSTAEAARILANAADNDLRPRVDLKIGVGYVGLDRGFGLQHFISTLYQNVPGLNTSVGLSYQLPTANTAARGDAMQAQATYEQERILAANLRRQISSGVSVAVEALDHSRRGLQESIEAVRLSETTVQNEVRKFQLGMSTLFDVIQAEDGLTSAQLGQISAQQSFAIALATLRLQTGTVLAAGSGDRAVTVALDALVQLP